MSRAEIRRNKREVEKQQKEPRYWVTESQIREMAQRAIGDELEKARQSAIDDASNQALVLMFTLPMKVLMDYYWPKTCGRKLPDFTQHLLDYYDQWQNGELDIDDVRNEVWERGGVKLVEEEE